MIFGFNTDIKHDDTVYHVQSEARENEYLLQTQVFVRGRCIGKRATSYSDHLQQPGFSDDSMHELLKAQHRSALDAIRSGNLTDFLGTQSESPAPSEPAPVSAPAAGLNLEILESGDLRANGSFVLKLRLFDSGSAISGARLISKVTSHSLTNPLYVQALTGLDGVGEIRISAEAVPASEFTVLVQSTHNGQTATRKLILRSTKEA